VAEVGNIALRLERVGVRGPLNLDRPQPLTRLAEFIIGPRFARTRWLADLSLWER
jgi:hypothetical protein